MNFLIGAVGVGAALFGGGITLALGRPLPGWARWLLAVVAAVVCGCGAAYVAMFLVIAKLMLDALPPPAGARAA